MADAGIALTGYSHRERATHNGGFCSISKCSNVIFTVIAAVAFVFVILGSIHLFGAVGSVGFIAALAAGGGVAALMMGALICSALSYCKKQNKDEPVSLLIPAVETFTSSITGAEGKSTSPITSVDGTSTIPITGTEDTSTSPMTGNSAESSKAKEKEKAQQMGLIKPLPPLLPECERALAFVREELEKFAQEELKKSDSKPKQLPGVSLYQDIRLLMPLYLNYKDNLISLIVNEKDRNPWSQDRVIKLADACIKLSYALGCMMLEDLPAFTKKLEEAGTKGKTYVQMLSKTSYYQCAIFYYCPSSYSYARGGVIFLTKEDDDGDLAICGEKYPNAEKQEYQDPFYTPGTKQHEWNILYNHYCQSVECYVSEKDLKNPDKRLYSWSREDKDRSFKVNPCEIPGQ